MSQANIMMGPGATFQFGGVTYVYSKGTCRLVIKKHDSNDSGNAAYDQWKPGRRHLEFDVEGYTQSDVFVTPPSTNVSGSSITFFPYGSGNTSFAASTTQIDEHSYDAPAQSGECATIAIRGVSTGNCTITINGSVVA